MKFGHQSIRCFCPTLYHKGNHPSKAMHLLGCHRVIGMGSQSWIKHFFYLRMIY